MANFRIAFIGKRRAGKDYLIQKLPECEVFSFSDSLKQIAHSVFPWLELDYPSDEKDKPLKLKMKGYYINHTPREIWNAFDSLRVIDKNIFVRRVENLIKENLDKSILVKDVRKQQEYRMLEKYNFKFIYIHNNFERLPLDEHDTLVEELLKPYADFSYENTKGDERINELLEYIEKQRIHND